jgi:phasin
MQEGVMAKEGTPRFEIPADMRAFAEKSVEQARQAFDIFISAAQHAVSTAENQAATMQNGVKEVGELAMGFAERNMTSSFEFAQRLMQVKDPKDVMALHADYVNSQIAALTEQVRNLANGWPRWLGRAPSAEPV